MVQVSDAQMLELQKPFQMIKQALADTPENKQYVKMVNECLDILNNAKSNPMGGSAMVTEKTKNLFEMFGLDKR